MQGLELEQYFQFTNSSLEDFKAQMTPMAEQKVRQLVLDTIAKLKIDVSEEDIDSELED